MVRRTLAISILLLAVAGCGDAQAKPEDENIYRAKNGVFSCPMPSLAEPGARTDEHFLENAFMVAFSDDFGQLVRIDGERANAPVPDQQEVLEEVLNNIFEGMSLPAFRQAAPTTAVLGRSFQSDFHDGALLVVVSLPGGSSISRSTDGGKLERLDALRSALLFFEGGWFFQVSVQLPPVVGENSPPGSPEAVERLNTLTFDFANSMDIHPN